LGWAGLNGCVAEFDGTFLILWLGTDTADAKVQGQNPEPRAKHLSSQGFDNLAMSQESLQH